MQNQIKPIHKGASQLPAEAQELGDFGFIGREDVIRQLEQLIQGEPAGILIHGPAGQGKTALAKGFLQRLETTNNLGAGAFWFNFENIHSVENVVNRMADRLFGKQVVTLPEGQKLAAVTKVLRDSPFFIVWDGFEYASGIPGSAIPALLNKKDFELLLQLLKDLRGGKTKVIIACLTREERLTEREILRLPLPGLHGDGLQEYCKAIIDDLGLSVDMENEAFQKLIDKLEGNPLIVRATLMRLREKNAEQLLKDIDEVSSDFKGDDSAKPVQVALSLFERGLDQAFTPVLQLIGLHIHYADAGMIGTMLKITDRTAPVTDCFDALTSAGLCRPMGNNVYKIHPALVDCLALIHPPEERDVRAFVDTMGKLADNYAERKPDQQQGVFYYFGESFYKALKPAEELDMREHLLALTKSLARYAQNMLELFEAERLFALLAEKANKFGLVQHASDSYYELGMLTQNRQDFAAAESWYKQSLTIEQEQGNDHGVAGIYHQLGMIAQEKRDFETAESWYKQGLAIDMKQGYEYGVAGAYYQLGRLAEEQQNFKTAEIWYKQSLAIFHNKGDEHGAAGAYRQLGFIAKNRGDYESAENWFRQWLAIEIRQDNEQGLAGAYYQLGTTAEEREDFAAAESWFIQSLSSRMRMDNQQEMAVIYNRLGSVTQKQQNYETAKSWYKQALEISTRMNDAENAGLAKNSLTLLEKSVKY